MHYAQSSVYAKVGMNKLIEVLRDDNNSPMMAEYLDTDVNAVLNQEPTDLSSQLSSNDIIF